MTIAQNMSGNIPSSTKYSVIQVIHTRNGRHFFVSDYSLKLSHSNFIVVSGVTSGISSDSTLSYTLVTTSTVPNDTILNFGTTVVIF